MLPEIRPIIIRLETDIVADHVLAHAKVEAAYREMQTVNQNKIETYKDGTVIEIKNILGGSASTRVFEYAVSIDPFGLGSLNQQNFSFNINKCNELTCGDIPGEDIVINGVRAIVTRDRNIYLGSNEDLMAGEKAGRYLSNWLMHIRREKAYTKPPIIGSIFE